MIKKKKSMLKNFFITGPQQHREGTPTPDSLLSPTWNLASFLPRDCKRRGFRDECLKWDWVASWWRSKLEDSCIGSRGTIPLASISGPWTWPGTWGQMVGLWVNHFLHWSLNEQKEGTYKEWMQAKEARAPLSIWAEKNNRHKDYQCQLQTATLSLLQAYSPSAAYTE